MYINLLLKFLMVNSSQTVIRQSRYFCFQLHPSSTKRPAISYVKTKLWLWCLAQASNLHTSRNWRVVITWKQNWATNISQRFAKRWNSITCDENVSVHTEFLFYWLRKINEIFYEKNLMKLFSVSVNKTPKRGSRWTRLSGRLLGQYKNQLSLIASSVNV